MQKTVHGKPRGDHVAFSVVVLISAAQFEMLLKRKKGKAALR